MSNRIDYLSDSVNEIRRDQLNYKIEKDLLKETYSTNIGQINLIITLILGIFAILGYLGFQGIDSIKRNFNNEYEKLCQLRKEFESKLLNIDEQLKSTKSEFEEIAKINVEQNNRLKILEIQEKSISSFKQKAYSRALEYANIGLEISKDNILLMEMKASSLMAMGIFNEACNVFEDALKLQPGDPSNLSNLIELSIFIGNVDYSRKLLNDNMSVLINANGPHFPWYIMALIYFFSGDIAQLKKHILSQPINIDITRTQRIKDWSYKEVLYQINKMQMKPGHDEILNTIKFLSGDMDFDDFKIKCGLVQPSECKK